MLRAHSYNRDEGGILLNRTGAKTSSITFTLRAQQHSTVTAMTIRLYYHTTIVASDRCMHVRVSFLNMVWVWFFAYSLTVITYMNYTCTCVRVDTYLTPFLLRHFMNVQYSTHILMCSAHSEWNYRRENKYERFDAPNHATHSTLLLDAQSVTRTWWWPNAICYVTIRFFLTDQQMWSLWLCLKKYRRHNM